MSRFTAIGRAVETDGHNESEGGPDMDARMEKALESIASDVDSVGDDPRSAAQIMRKLSGTAGIRMNDTMEQALKRIESGEDPEQIEADMGDALASENPFGAENDKRSGTRKLAGIPKRDATLYEM